jgi:hypothetical protein
MSFREIQGLGWSFDSQMTQSRNGGLGESPHYQPTTFTTQMIFGNNVRDVFLQPKKLPGFIHSPMESACEAIRLSLQMASHKKISRNQWVSEEIFLTYRKLISFLCEEIELNAPKYFNRLRLSLSKANGKVFGCGIGTITRCLSTSADVQHIWGVEAFREAVETLKAFDLPEATPLTLPVEDPRLISGVCFGTVMICELIEHLFPYEEKKMLKFLYSLIDSMAKFPISVPIRTLQDPHHLRSLSRRNFRKHLVKYYGNPIEIDYSSDSSQVPWGHFDLVVLDKYMRYQEN